MSSSISWRGTQLEPGTGLRSLPTGVALAGGSAVVRYADPHTGAVHTGTAATWRSPLVTCEPFTRLVPFWGAQCPDGTWAVVEARVVATDGRRSGWHTLAVWSAAEPPASPTRTSVPGRADDIVAVDTDELSARDGAALVGWQVQVTLVRSPGAADPVLELAGAAAGSRVEAPVAASEPTARGVEVDVPAYTQRAHLGRYPEWDGGGASWCSATSLAMALDALGAGPGPDELGWVEEGPRPQVVHAVRGVFDHAYRGAGNWAFNCAHAWTRGLDAQVARVRDLTEVEPLLVAGSPVVVSTAFTKDQLPQAGYETRGHLVLVVGVDAAGDPIVHDPNSHLTADEGAVRTVYPRLAFEQAMARAGGAAYVLRRR